MKQIFTYHEHVTQCLTSADYVQAHLLTKPIRTAYGIVSSFHLPELKSLEAPVCRRALYRRLQISMSTNRVQLTELQDRKYIFLMCGKLHNVKTNGLILLHYAFVAGKYKVPNSGTASPQGPRPEARLPEPPHHVR